MPISCELGNFLKASGQPVLGQPRRPVVVPKTPPRHRDPPWRAPTVALHPGPRVRPFPQAHTSRAQSSITRCNSTASVALTRRQSMLASDCAVKSSAITQPRATVYRFTTTPPRLL